MLSKQQKSTQTIKKSIALRAKYRAKQEIEEPTYVVMSPLSVVPHPKNRGGVPATSLRTKELTGTITFEACDVSEANHSAVAVEDQPADVMPRPPWYNFQSAFEQQVKCDQYMCKGALGIRAILGSLSHGHFNCCCRNILSGQSGCECPTRGDGASDFECTCKASPILDADGTYSMEKLEDHDKPWCDLCHTGLRWEVLSWKMDAEEPDGALVISIALNKKNEAAMKTGVIEMWNTLVGLCKPDPHTGITPFDPIRDRLVDLYGAHADSPHLFQMFRLVLDVGGHDSLHLQDFLEFTGLLVNPKLRKLREESYTVVAHYPEPFPRLKFAALKWAYKQIPIKGWCPKPDSISHRFEGGKGVMRDLLYAAEDTMLWISKFFAAAVKANETVQAQKVKWEASVEVTIMGIIFGGCKSHAKVDEQERQLMIQCGKAVASKLVEFGDACRPKKPVDQLKTLAFPSNPIFESIAKALNDMNAGKVVEGCRQGCLSQATSTVVVELQPKALKLDSDGRIVSTHEVYRKVEPEKEPLPWYKFVGKQHEADDINEAKAVFRAAMLEIQKKESLMGELPLALLVEKSSHIMRSTQAFPKGSLFVPLFYMRETNVCSVDDSKSVRHPNAVDGAVKWPVTDAEKLVGIDDDWHEYRFYVNPEVKLPKKGQAGKWMFSPGDALHPFWIIPRQSKEGDPWNMELSSIEVTTVVASNFDCPLLNTAKHPVFKTPMTGTMKVTLPCLVNSKDIEAGELVILKMALKAKAKAKAKQSGITWTDKIQQQENKRHKPNPPAKNG